MDKESIEKELDYLSEHADDRSRKKHYMDELDDHFSNRPTSDALYFANSTAQYILSSSENKSAAANERDIEDVMSNIPIRINRLLCDLATLSKGQYLDDLDKNWSHMDQIPRWSSFATRTIQRRDPDRHEKDHFNLGFDIGLALSCLTGTLSEDSRASVFLAGLTTAYSTNQTQSKSSNVNIREAKRKVESSTRQVSFRTKSNAEAKISAGSRETLQKYGVECTDYIMRIINTVSNLHEDAKKEKISRREAIQAFFEHNADELFGKCIHVRGELDREWESISEASVPGMEAEDALRAIWELRSDENFPDKVPQGSSKKIALQAKSSDKYKRTVSHVLNQLSKDGKNPSDEVIQKYETKPIVKYNNRWKLTGYGQLLLYYVFEKGRNPRWIQMCAIGFNVPSAPATESVSSRDMQMLEEGVDNYFNKTDSSISIEYTRTHWMHYRVS